MTLEERALAIAACRNGLVPGSHLHRRLVAFALQQLREAVDEAMKKSGGERADAGGDEMTRLLNSFETAAIMRDLRRKIKPASKCVLIALRIQGGGTLAELASMMQMAPASIYYALEHLRSKDIVVRSQHEGQNGKKFYTYKIAAVPAALGAGGDAPGHAARSLG